MLELPVVAVKIVSSLEDARICGHRVHKHLINQRDRCSQERAWGQETKRQFCLPSIVHGTMIV